MLTLSMAGRPWTVWPSARCRQGPSAPIGGRRFSGRRRTDGRENLAVLAALSGASLLVAACGGGSPSAHRASSSALPGTAATPTPNTEDAAIISAYRAAETAFEEAVAIPDPAYPALAATMVDPLLQRVRLNLITDKNNGIVGRGHVQSLRPHVISRSDGKAILLDCTYSTLGAFYSSGGKPVPGSEPVPEYGGVRATLIMVAPGTWKLSDTDVRLGKCPPGY
jgi:hypothetical protein